MKACRIAAIPLVLLASAELNAWAFYWSKVEVQSSSWQTCMSFAQSVAQRRHLAQVRRTNLDVSGNSNGASASITCIGTGPNSKAMAVVMVVGDADAPVRQLRDDLANAIHSIRLLDNNP